MKSLVDILRQLSEPREPLPTQVEPQLDDLSHVRCVLFDVYGTLLISGSGEVGSANLDGRPLAWEAAFRAAKMECPCTAETGLAEFIATIRGRQQELKQMGNEFPEVDILRVWQDTLAALGCGGPEENIQRLAVEYEARSNPCWPMPAATDVLAALRQHEFTMGIVSNAQFYTLQLFQALFGSSPDALGFDPNLQFYSYRHRAAKPGSVMFELAERELKSRGFHVADTLYVGNDMVNDIWPAQQVGFHTALFAGDRRSLRQRTADPRVAGVQPDVILTHWSQLLTCLQV